MPSIAVRLLSAGAALVLTTVAGSTPLKAQSCFRGRPLPTCTSFWITEFGVALGFTRDTPAYYTWEFGWMVNRGERSALGATILLGAGGGGRVGLKPRLRHWLADGKAVEVSAGLLITSPGEGFGFTGHVGLNLNDKVILAIQLEVFEHPSSPVPVFDFDPNLITERPPSDLQARWYGGVKLGSQPAVIAMAVSLVAGAVAAAIVSTCCT